MPPRPPLPSMRSVLVCGVPSFTAGLPTRYASRPRRESNPDHPAVPQRIKRHCQAEPSSGTCHQNLPIRPDSHTTTPFAVQGARQARAVEPGAPLSRGPGHLDSGVVVTARWPGTRDRRGIRTRPPAQSHQPPLGGLGRMPACTPTVCLPAGRARPRPANSQAYSVTRSVKLPLRTPPWQRRRCSAASINAPPSHWNPNFTSHGTRLRPPFPRHAQPQIPAADLTDSTRNRPSTDSKTSPDSELRRGRSQTNDRPPTFPSRRILKLTTTAPLSPSQYPC